jgi:hypothetical protein
MATLIIVVVFLFALSHSQGIPQNCTLSQSGWLHFFATTLDEEPVPPITLCDVDLPRLMRVDVARLIQPWNSLWVSVGQVYLTALLNAWSVTATCNLSANGVSQALLLMGDSLTQSCGNLSAWTLEPVLNQANSLLMRLNEGQLDQCVQCVVDDDDDTTNNNNNTNGNQSSVLPFYYYQEPDIVTLRLMESNTTLTYSLLKGRWNTTLGLSLLCVAQFLCIIILLIMVILLYNPNKRYLPCRPRSYETVKNETELDGLSREHFDLNVINELQNIQ